MNKEIAVSENIAFVQLWESNFDTAYQKVKFKAIKKQQVKRRAQKYLIIYKYINNNPDNCVEIEEHIADNAANLRTNLILLICILREYHHHQPNIFKFKTLKSNWL